LSGQDLDSDVVSAGGEVAGQSGGDRFGRAVQDQVVDQPIAPVARNVGLVVALHGHACGLPPCPCRRARVVDLAEMLGLAHSTASKHLACVDAPPLRRKGAARAPMSTPSTRRRTGQGDNGEAQAPGGSDPIGRLNNCSATSAGRTSVTDTGLLSVNMISTTPGSAEARAVTVASGRISTAYG
jgi:hypothetical protein